VLLRAQSGFSDRGEDLVVSYRHGGQEFEMPLPVRWNFQSAFELSPRRAYFGEVQANKEVGELEVVVRRSDGKRFTVQRVRQKHEAINCTVEPTNDRTSWVLKVNLDASKVQHFLWEEIVVETDQMDQTLFLVPVVAFPPSIRGS
jgi:hypothetical protein